MRAPRGIYRGEHLWKQSSYKATGEFRPPKKGEYYLSGAIIAAYEAPNDLSTAYWIAKPVNLITCLCCGVGKVAMS